MSTRKLNAAFAQLIQSRNARVVSLEADPAEVVDPTTTNAPDTSSTDDEAVSLTAEADEVTEAVETPVVDPVLEPVADPVETPVEVPAETTPEPAVDPTVAVTDPASDPVTEMVAEASAGEADVGEGEEPTKVIVEVNVTNPTEAAEIPAVLDPVIDPIATPVEDVVVPAVVEDVLVDPVTGVTVTDPNTPVVVTDMVAPVVDDSIASSFLVEEELKTLQISSAGDTERLEVLDATVVKITELEAEIKQYEDGHETMKKMTQVLDTSTEEGGITDNAASILKVAVEHISNQLGMGESVMLGIPSLESFALPGSRLSATSLALEDIKETVNKIWAAIQAGYKKVMEWLGNFFKHLTDVNARLMTRATQIQSMVSTLKGSHTATPVTNARIARALARGQAISKNVPKDLDDVNKFSIAAQTGAPQLFQQVVSLMKKVEAEVSKEDLDLDAVNSVSEELTKVALKMATSLGSAGGMKKSTGSDSEKWYGLPSPTATQDFYVSDILLGNKIVYAFIPNDGGNGYRAGQATGDVGEINDNVPVLTSQQIAAVAASVIEHSKAAAGGQSVWEGAQEVYKTVLAGAQAANTTANMQGKKGMEKFRLFAAFLKDARAMCSGIHQPAMAIATAANAAALDYAQMSLKALTSAATADMPAGAVPATESFEEQLTEEELAMEGLVDALKSPLQTLKKAFTVSDEKKFKNEIQVKLKVLQKERVNLQNIKKALAHSKDDSSHVINLKKAQGHWNFDATNPNQLIAGLTKNAKYLEKVGAEIKTIKTKDAANALKDKVEAEMSKKGSVPETMTFNRLQAQAYLEASTHLVESMIHFLTSLETLAHLQVSTEGIGSDVFTIIKIVLSIIVLTVWAKLAAAAIFMIALSAALVNPFLGVAVGLVLFGVALKGAAHIGKKLGEWITNDGTAGASHSPHLPVSEATHGMQPAKL